MQGMEVREQTKRNLGRIRRKGISELKTKSCHFLKGKQHSLGKGAAALPFLEGTGIRRGYRKVGRLSF